MWTIERVKNELPEVQVYNLADRTTYTGTIAGRQAAFPSVTLWTEERTPLATYEDAWSTIVGALNTGMPLIASPSPLDTVGTPMVVYSAPGSAFAFPGRNTVCIYPQTFSLSGWWWPSCGSSAVTRHRRPRRLPCQPSLEAAEAENQISPARRLRCSGCVPVR